MQPKFLHYFLRDIKETSRTSVFSINQKLDTRLLTYSPGQIYVNLAGLKSAEAEIDWGQYHLPPKHGGANFKDVAGTGKPFEEMEQIFLLKHDGTKDNRYLHDVPHYFMIDSKTRFI
jgi:hypothetical protein